MEHNELKPCPYCGSEVEIIDICEEGERAFYMVQCKNDEECGAGCTFGEGSKTAIAKRWNRRANDEPSKNM